MQHCFSVDWHIIHRNLKVLFVWFLYFGIFMNVKLHQVGTTFHGKLTDIPLGEFSVICISESETKQLYPSLFLKLHDPTSCVLTSCIGIFENVQINFFQFTCIIDTVLLIMSLKVKLDQISTNFVYSLRSYISWSTYHCLYLRK